MSATLAMPTNVLMCTLAGMASNTYYTFYYLCT